MIEHVQQQAAPIDPAVEGRLQFIYDLDPPAITISSPTATSYLHPAFLTLDFTVLDVGPAGLKWVEASLDGTPVVDGQVIDLLTLSLGSHTLRVQAMDKAGNESSASVTFTVTASPASLAAAVERFHAEGKIENKGVYTSLMKKLRQAMSLIAKGKTEAALNVLRAFVNEVRAQRGKQIAAGAADVLIADATWVMDQLRAGAKAGGRAAAAPRSR